MSTPSTNSKFEYLKDYSRVILFYFVGLSIFFIAGFLIISLRVSTKEKIQVPNLVGKLYLDEHNRLVEDGFKVKINRTFSIEYPFGYIISQSQSPGLVVKEGAKLVLLVNQSKTVVKTPQLVGQKEELVGGILASIPQGRRTFKLNKGNVTYISSERAKGDILAQFPPAGTPVVPESPVSLLVSAGDKKIANDRKKNSKGKKKKKKKTALNFPDIKGSNIEIVKALSYHYRMALAVSAKLVDDPQESGRVLAYSLSSGEDKFFYGNEEQVSLKVTVGQLRPMAETEEVEQEYPFQFIWVKPDDIDLLKGKNTVAQVTNKDIKQVVGVEPRKYFSAFYLENTGALIPFFKEDKNNFAAWAGYAENVLTVPLEEKAKSKTLQGDKVDTGEPDQDEDGQDIRRIEIEEEKEANKDELQESEPTLAKPKTTFQFSLFEI